MSTLQRLQSWYFMQCNGEWEHQRGINIESCDNPGWWVKIDLAGTFLEGRPFSRVAENVDQRGFQLGARWIHCHVEGQVWDGAGDESRLEQILELFLAWADQQQTLPATRP